MMNRIHEYLFDKSFRCCLLIAIFMLIMSISFWQGMQSTDDLGYALQASHILKHGFIIDDTSHKVGRIGAYLPLSVVFWLFGINELSLSLIPILSSIATSVLIFLLGKRLYDSCTGLIAAFLYIFLPLTLQNGNIFVPEPIIGAELCAASLLFLKANPDRTTFFDTNKFVSGLLVGFAYLTSEVGATMVPAFLAYSLISRNATRNLWSFVLGFVFVLCAEISFFMFVYGNPFYKFISLGGSYINDPMLLASNKYLFYRLFKAYPKHFIYPEFGFAFFGPLLITGGVSALFHIRKNLFLLIWAGTIFGFYNFMSVRFDEYVVLPVASRLIYPGCLPLLITSAKFLLNFWQWIRKRASLLRLSFQCFYIIVIIWLFSTSILATFLNLNISYTSILARNSKAAASFLENESSIVLVSDNRTLKSISFYRGLTDSDTLLEFKEHSKSESLGRKFVEEINYIVINGPIYNIAEGSDGFFPYNPQREYLMDNALRYKKNTDFEYRYKRGDFFEYLFWHSMIMHCSAVKIPIQLNSFFDRIQFCEYLIFFLKQIFIQLCLKNIFQFYIQFIFYYISKNNVIICW